MAEIPKGKKLVLICNTGLPSHEAQVTLDHMGMKDTCNLQGGVPSDLGTGSRIVSCQWSVVRGQID